MSRSKAWTIIIAAALAVFNLVMSSSFATTGDYAAAAYFLIWFVFACWFISEAGKHR